MKKLFILVFFFGLNLYSQEKDESEESSVSYFKTILRSSEKVFKILGYFHYVENFNNIKKFDNSFVRIESRIGIYNIDSKPSIIEGLYSVYDDYTNEPLGYLTYSNRRGYDLNDYYIKQLHINPKYRYKKIGKLLLTFALERFKLQNINTVYLDACRFDGNIMSNEDLIRYYKKFGFKSTEKYERYMQLQLNDKLSSKL